jgi:hypothetical protein
LTGRRLVVGDDDRILRVDEARDEQLAPYVGRSLWTYLPEAQPLLGPFLEEARASRAPVESTIFYAGWTVDVRIVPVGDVLTVQLERRTELDVSTLETLAASLRSIEAELAAREHVRRDRRAPASPQALP